MPRPKKPAPQVTPPPGPPAQAPPLRLLWMDPAELAENPGNWRLHPAAQRAALADVLADVGWAGACLYNECTGRLIDGHLRRTVALEQGGQKVPVLVGSWTEEQERLILATLDPLAAMAGADAGALDVLLKDVQSGSAAVGTMLAGLALRSGLDPAGGVDDPAAHWQGMPGFRHEDRTAGGAFIIRVFLKDAEDLAAFGRLLGKDLTGRKFVWFGKQPRGETYEAFDGPDPEAS